MSKSRQAKKELIKDKKIKKKTFKKNSVEWTEARF